MAQEYYSFMLNRFFETLVILLMLTVGVDVENVDAGVCVVIDCLDDVEWIGSLMLYCSIIVDPRTTGRNSLYTIFWSSAITICLAIW